ncbi:hypothetical protein CAEBREN_03441 [Caenorhabditis brenneri]|uniref:K Homology domain-containing protein n=1 Tax=Caenorhabditis brenneri TaxID=135651 RepID=G0N3H1_CAEBE|nr:hypothetical protein CAEBREN_03441 [Caenorhabditis brenneri]
MNDHEVITLDDDGEDEFEIVEQETPPPLQETPSKRFGRQIESRSPEEVRTMSPRRWKTRDRGGFQRQNGPMFRSPVRDDGWRRSPMRGDGCRRSPEARSGSMFRSPVRGDDWRRSPEARPSYSKPRPTSPRFSRYAYREPMDQLMSPTISMSGGGGPVRNSHRRYDHHRQLAGSMPRDQIPIYLARHEMQCISLNDSSYDQYDDAYHSPSPIRHQGNIFNFHKHSPKNNDYGIQIEGRRSVFDRISFHENPRIDEYEARLRRLEQERSVEIQRKQQKNQQTENLLRQIEGADQEQDEINLRLQRILEEKRLRNERNMIKIQEASRRIESDSRRYEPYPSSRSHRGSPRRPSSRSSRFDYSPDREYRRESRRHLDNSDIGSEPEDRRYSRQRDEEPIILGKGAYKPRRMLTDEEMEAFCPSTLSANISALPREVQEKIRRDREHAKERERRRQKHPISYRCVKYFQRVKDDIEKQIKCSMELDKEPFQCRNLPYYNIILESEKPEEIDRARDVIDDYVLGNMEEELGFQTRVTVAIWLSPRTRTALKNYRNTYSMTGHSEVHRLGRDFAVEVTFSQYNTDPNPPAMVEGTLENIGLFQKSFERFVDGYYEMMNYKIRTEFDFPMHIFSAFVGSGGCHIKELEKETNSKITIFRDRQTIEILAESEEDVEIIKRKIDELNAENRKRLSDAENDDYMYKIAIPKDLVGKVIGHRGNQLQEVRLKSGARCEMDDEVTGDGRKKTLIVSGSFEQAQMAYHLVNKIMGLTPEDHEYSFIPADNFGQRRPVYRRTEVLQQRLSQSSISIIST